MVNGMVLVYCGGGRMTIVPNVVCCVEEMDGSTI
jgi:hypothetical protein